MTEKETNGVELPAPTAWPLVLAAGIVLMMAGMATSLGFILVGLPVFLVGAAGWVGQLTSALGNVQEPLVEPSRRPAPTAPAPGTVEPMRPGAVGYRFRLPEHVHPISSGVKGGLLGGLVMPIPALAFGLLAYGSVWFPINLLAGMVIPGITDASLESLKQFNLMALLVGSIIHVAFSVTFGLMYGVILPTLPQIRGGPLLYGGVLMPLFWSAACYGLMGVVNPLLGQHVSWPWFVLSQFVYGLAMSYVVFRSEMVAVEQPGGQPAA